VAALAAAITNAATGVISSTGEALWQKISGQQPLLVSTSVAFEQFQTQPVPFVGAQRYWLFLHPIESLVYPKDADQGIQQLNSWDGWDRWARQYGGIPSPGETIVRAVIQGRSASPIVLLDLRIRVLQRRSPPKGTRIHVGGGGPLSSRYFTANLDTDPPHLSYETGEDTSERPIQFPYKVSDTDPEVFVIDAVTAQYDCTWVAELYWSFEGKNGTTIIDDGGKPFRTVSGKNAPVYTALDGRFVKAK
jgi:hypothetical protein